LELRLDPESCVSSGKCVADRPTAFGFDDDEVAVVLPGASLLDDAAMIAAARRCPSGAISVVGEAGKTLDL